MSGGDQAVGAAGDASTPVVGAVIVAAGRAERMGGLEKMLVPLGGLPLLAHSIKAFEEAPAVREIVVVAREDLVEKFRALVAGRGFSKVTHVVPGGATRAESSRHGLAALSREVEFVLVHDGGRPLVSQDVIGRVVEAAVAFGAAVPGVLPIATIKKEDAGKCAGTVDRAQLREAQTPQGFRRDWLAKAMAKGMRDHLEATDESMLIEHAGFEVRLVEGERKNLKVTTLEDLTVAEAFLEGRQPAELPRVGLGFDVHAFAEGRPLVLGCVEIPHSRGLEGHSDADVVAHAICDALLGAASAADIGVHFPNTDEAFRGAPGRDLLTRTVEILREVGYVPLNVDATVCAEAPRLSPYRDEMVRRIAAALRLSSERVSVKFTTTEGLGFEGREEGISAQAIALVARIPWLPERT